jgi:hypothetical protein
MKSILIFVLFTSTVLFAGTAGLTQGGDFSTDITLVNINYYGQCPGYSKGTTDAWFRSETTATAPNLRVKVKNVTEGMNKDPYPFTDREYDKGNRSEHTVLKPSHRHRGSTFSVINGLNKFKYKIYDTANDNAVVEKGEFEVNIFIDVLNVEKNMVPEWEWRCTGGYPGGYPGGGQNCGWYQTWKCPM